MQMFPVRVGIIETPQSFTTETKVLGYISYIHLEWEPSLFFLFSIRSCRIWFTSAPAVLSHLLSLHKQPAEKNLWPNPQSIIKHCLMYINLDRWDTNIYLWCKIDSNRFVNGRCTAFKSMSCSQPWNIQYEWSHYLKRLSTVATFCQHISGDVNKTRVKGDCQTPPMLSKLKSYSKHLMPLCVFLSLCSWIGQKPTAVTSKPQKQAASLYEKTSIWQLCLLENITTKLFHDLTTKCIHIADTEAISLCLRDGPWISWGINHVECLPKVWYTASI